MKLCNNRSSNVFSKFDYTQIRNDIEYLHSFGYWCDNVIPNWAASICNAYDFQGVNIDFAIDEAMKYLVDLYEEIINNKYEVK